MRDIITSLRISLPFALCLLILGTASAAEWPVVGKLTSITRQVETTQQPVTAPRVWAAARLGQEIHAQQGVRTLKRALAEIRFTDASLLRVNERSDLVVEEAAQLRKIKLQAGAVWVRVTKGANTSVETPTCTAAAKGTVFVVITLPDGRSRTLVLEGTVEVTAGADTVLVSAGQAVETRADGTLDPVVDVPTADLPVEYGGTVEGWWNTLVPGVSIIVTPGTHAAYDLRTSALAEGNMRPDDEETYPEGYLGDPLLRDSLLTIAQQSILPVYQSELTANPSMTLDDYKLAHGDTPLSGLEMSAANQAFIESLGITTIGEFIHAIQVNGGSIIADLGVPAGDGLVVTVRAIRPGAVAANERDLGLLDRTKTSNAVLAAGLLTGLIADRGHWTIITPRVSGELYGTSGQPSFLGGRGDMRGRIGNTLYRVEANAIKFVHRPVSDWVSRVGSVAVVERPVGDGWRLFAGRRRFYAGPVFADVLGTQLIADRYSGAGASYHRGRWGFEGAWLYDSNSEVQDAQRGALGSLTYRVAGGTFGVHVLQTSQIARGHGRTASFTLPLSPNQIDMYGEVGTGIDDATLQTYGLYFPGLYQRTDVDLFLEYGQHEGLGEAMSFTAVKQVRDDLEVRAYGKRVNDVTVLGVAALWKFGQTAQ